VSVDTPKFKELLGEYSLSLECDRRDRELCEERFIAARAALVEHLNAELESARAGRAHTLAGAQ
jgi:hypothetical protein